MKNTVKRKNCKKHPKDDVKYILTGINGGFGTKVGVFCFLSEYHRNLSEYHQNPSE